MIASLVFDARYGTLTILVWKQHLQRTGRYEARSVPMEVKRRNVPQAIYLDILTSTGSHWQMV
jgi:hypothetical protein